MDECGLHIDILCFVIWFLAITILSSMLRVTVPVTPIMSCVFKTRNKE